MLAALGRGVDNLFGSRPLVHLCEHLVRSGFCAAEDHGKAGRLERAPGVVGKASERVDPRLAPPAQPQRMQSRRDLARMGLVQEEIIVVEMDRIHSMLAGQEAEMLGGAHWPLDLFAPAENGDDAAEIAAERAADRRLVDAGPATKDGRVEILSNVDLVIGRGR